MRARPANHYADIEVTRANFKALMAPRMSADPRVVISDAVADGVPVQVIRPAVQDAGPLPCVLYIHGALARGTPSRAGLSQDRVTA